MHPTGAMEKDDRLNGLMGADGITNCGNAQNCVQVCPMSIPLTRAIYETNRDVTVDALLGWLRK
jgi:succinate dehydrogenase / fumarate reductase iron-sulfur subunit